MALWYLDERNQLMRSGEGVGAWREAASGEPSRGPRVTGYAHRRWDIAGQRGHVPLIVCEMCHYVWVTLEFKSRSLSYRNQKEAGKYVKPGRSIV